MDFTVFSKAVDNQFKKMTKGNDHILYEISVGKNDLWDIYLDSFPEGTDPIYKERTEHDCSCCKHFVRDIGGVVIIKEDMSLESIWDIKIGGVYQIVADALSEYVKMSAISNLLSTFSAKVGANETLQQLEDGHIKTWNHFHASVPVVHVNKTPEDLGQFRTIKQVFKRGLDELTKDAVGIVLELSAQDSLYKGEEFQGSVRSFSKLQRDYIKIKDPMKADRFCWLNYHTYGAGIRNTVIGTLIQDISEGMDLDRAVSSYEAKVAPTNYKRPTALITKGMIEQAMKTIKELNVEDSIYRRFAVAEDLSVNNVLFAHRDTASVMKDDIFDCLMAATEAYTQDKNKYSQVEEIHISKFLTLIPTLTKIEVLVENRHTKNLMSLIAPKHDSSPNILKWGNNFSWTYNGDLTDSIIKERVKKAGGNVDAFLRISLSWFNYDDLDIHITEPKGNRIHFGNKTHHKTTGQLDVDMNAGGRSSREAVENIVWTDPSKMERGDYKVIVNNYCKRETVDEGFTVEMEIDGDIKTYTYSKKVKNQENIKVITFHFDGKQVTNVKVGIDIKDKALSQDLWGIKTEQFQNTSIMTVSPNHWDEQKIGNKHYFFILKDCVNPDQARGFYNEFLDTKLEKHRKVFEVLGSKTKCEEAENQLSGIGFSSTKRDSVICRVSGKFDRTLKVNF